MHPPRFIQTIGMLNESVHKDPFLFWIIHDPVSLCTLILTLLLLLCDVFFSTYLSTLLYMAKCSKRQLQNGILNEEELHQTAQNLVKLEIESKAKGK